MNQKKKLIDVLTNNTGLFLALNEQFGGTLSEPKYYYDMFEWSKDLLTQLKEASNYNITDLSMLDIEYFFNESGQKLISPLLNHKLVNGKMPTTSSWTYFWQLAIARFKLKWDKDWESLSAEYNPIENYSMVEEEELPKKTTETKHFEDYNITTSENTDKDIHQEENADIDTTQDVYGFNSPSSVPIGSTNESKDKTKNYVDTNESGLAENNYITEAHSKDGDDNKEITTEEWNKKRTLTRKGNIGVTTSQQMIDSTIKLYQFNFIRDVVYRDLDDLLTLGIYESEL